MSYQVLAQKYRPQTFDEVIGQEVVTRTLKNSIAHGRVANAYIFCGPRGVGKTTVARLLSKTLNCEQPAGKSPCNRCSSCKEISQGISMDVLEIDGASNRGIDEIRTLRENVKFSPSKGKFKIYIIDEVHMLTTEAFNALLKTLEEPPLHVKFVFATTEPHKVIPTIMSRCQRFDFKKIPPKMIYDRVMGVAKEEKIAIDEKAGLLIARSADGSLRDSLVILDQVVSFTDKPVSMDDVLELLGMIHKDKIFELSDAVIDNDPKLAACISDELINSGKDPVFITNSLIGHFRDLLVLKVVGAPTSDMAFTDDELAKMRAQLEKLSVEEILYILQNLSNCLTFMKGAMFSRAPLEIALVRLAKRQQILSLEEILAKLEEMEEDNHENNSGISHLEMPKSRFPAKVSKASIERDSIEGPGDAGSAEADFDATKYQWKALLNHVREKKMSVFMFLNVGKLVEFGGDKVVIGFKKEHLFHKEALEVGENKKIIEEAAKVVTGGSPQVEFTFLEFLGGNADDSAGSSEQGTKTGKTSEEVKPHIEKAMDIFGGHVIRDFPEEEK